MVWGGQGFIGLGQGQRSPENIPNSWASIQYHFGFWGLGFVLEFWFWLLKVINMYFSLLMYVWSFYFNSSVINIQHVSFRHTIWWFNCHFVLVSFPRREDVGEKGRVGQENGSFLRGSQTLTFIQIAQKAHSNTECWGPYSPFSFLSFFFF